MKVKLKILASDILEDKYMNSNDCPITRALRKAGLNDYKDAGLCISAPQGDVTPRGYKALTNKLMPMVNFVVKRNGRSIVGPDQRVTKPKNFEVELTFPKQK